MITTNVYVEFGAHSVSPEHYGDLMEALADHAPGVGPAANGNLSARLFVNAETVLDALAQAVKITSHAVRGLGLPDTIVGVEALTEAEFERREAEPQVPELAGVTEAAAILDVHKQQIARLVERGELVPVQDLAGGSVFAAAMVRTYAEKKHSRRIGRPVKDLGLSPAEHALLDALVTSAREGTPASTVSALNEALVEVFPDARIRMHYGPHTPDLTSALDRLVDHKLVRTRSLTKAEQKEGNTSDLVVTVLDKGARHAQAASSAGDTTP
ncbi:helix-turn-helix domain-containing protein [Streptomyces sp. NPDC020800]|uniref:helix-turn-helix domain-containing protein n=1 Tax=Streptomyces sp. NPDC020800 TaxID=3365092 RepID=UPI003795A864